MNNRYFSLVNHIGQYVHDHLAEDISGEKLANHVGISKFHINRIFHASTGFQLVEFIQSSRVGIAHHPSYSPNHSHPDSCAGNARPT